MEESFAFLDDGGEVYPMLRAAFEGDIILFKYWAHKLDEENNLAETITFAMDIDYRNALHAAAYGGQTHILKYLVRQLKLDVNVIDDLGDTPLHCAIKRKHFHTAVFLIDNGADLNATNDEWFTALHCAAMEGHKKLVQMLISKGAEVDANPDTGTPLQRAANLGKKDSVKVLLEKNANPNIFSDQTVTPLVLAANNGSMECVKLLLKLGYTSIEVAAIAENRDAVMILYPICSPISYIPDWTIDGIMLYYDLGGSLEKRKKPIQLRTRAPIDFTESKLMGTEAFKRMDYRDAIRWYTKAINCNDMDATLYSNRSLCWARLEDGKNALVDAQMCVKLDPTWPKAYYRLGAAWMLLKEFGKAADAFNDGLKLNPENKELNEHFVKLLKLNEMMVEEIVHLSIKLLIVIDLFRMLNATPHKCPACYKQFNRKLHLIEHMKISYHSVHQPRCGVCQKHTKSFESVREHINSPIAKTNCSKIFEERGCNLCLKVLGSPSSLNEHKQMCRLIAPVPLGTKITPCTESRAIMSGSVMDERHNGQVQRAIAMDCEMVGGGHDGSIDLCARVCLVDEDGNIILHSYVQPQTPVTDYRYEVTGLTEDHLKDAMPLNEVQEKVTKILHNGESVGRIPPDGGRARLLVGHGIQHDLECLRMKYPGHLLRDTSKYRPLMKTCLVSHSLKYLTKTYLGYNIQSGIHDPYEDCISVMRLYKRMRGQDHQQVVGVGDEKANSGFDSFRSVELDKMTPDELSKISISDYKCWCLDLTKDCNSGS